MCHQTSRGDTDCASDGQKDLLEEEEEGGGGGGGEGKLRQRGNKSTDSHPTPQQSQALLSLSLVEVWLPNLYR